VAIPQTLSKKLDALASKMQLASAQAATTIEQVA
jgi:3-(3-hydroxy-phenyl)propionate hydroxylase